jgi:hypothetical protein
MDVRKRLILIAAIALAATAVKVQPAHTEPHYAWQGSYKAVVDQTAAVVQGTVTGVTESYNEKEGPRTLVTLSELNVLWGEIKSSNVTLRLFGGPVPDRRGRIQEVHIPTFVRGKTYLVFLSNRDWRLSPVTGRQSFIVEKVQGKEILVTTDGYAIFGIDDVIGPIRKFPIYRIPDETDETFVPSIDKSVTPSMVADAYSASEFVTELKAWASRKDVSVKGTFHDQPYSSTGSWRAVKETAGKSSGREPVEQLETGRPSAPDPEKEPCWNRLDPRDSDADPKDFSSMCREAGPQ